MKPPRLPPPWDTTLEARRLTLDDVDSWAEYATLPEVIRHTSSAARSAADLAPMVERSLVDDPAAPVLFGVFERGRKRVLAVIGFHSISPLNRSAEITYNVRPEWWGRGLASALCRTAVGWAFEDRGWVRVQATVLPENAASLAVLRKCGFHAEGTLRAFRLVQGRPRAYLVFSRLPGDAEVDGDR